MISKVPWSDEAEKGLKVSAGPDMSIIRDEVNRGISELFKVDREDAKGYIVTRIEWVAGDDELVVVLGEGRGFNVMIPMIMETAKSQGMTSVRAHVNKSALVRMYESFDFVVDEIRQDETVMRYFFDGR